MRGLRQPLLVGLVALLFAARAGAKEDPDTEIARRRFDRGLQLYEAGEYRNAIGEFEAARKLVPSAAFDYNIARCYDRLEEPARAIEAYQRYLATEPDDAGAVRERVQVLRLRLPAPAAIEPSPPPVAAAPATPEPRGFSVAWPAAFLALTAAVVAAGGALYGVSGQRYDDLVRSGCGMTMICGQDRYGPTQRMEQAGIGLLVSGGVTAVIDVALWAAWGRRHRAAPSFASSLRW